MGDAALSLVVLKTRQVDALCGFYSSLGIKLIKEQHGKGPVHYSGQVGETVLEIYPLPEDGAPADASTRLGFVVTKVSETVEALRALNASIVSEPRETQWGFRAVVRDPDGRAVELCQR